MVTIGEITLPVYAKAINLSTIFLIVDVESVYNIILGYSWIYNIRAVTSTYHKVIKFLTKWGVKEISGEQRALRGCYYSSLNKKR